MRSVCLIPARGGSKRFPGKNIAPLNGRPLLAYAIEAAQGADLFQTVWVSTDDPRIAEVARRSGAAVHDRPPALATDEAGLVQVCLEFADWRERQGEPVEVLCVVLPTAVLLDPSDLRDGYRLLAQRNADFVMGVTTYLESPFQALWEVEGYLRPYFKDLCLKKSQELPKVTVDSGSFYLARMRALRAERTFYGRRLVGYQIPRHWAVDIDEPEHLKIVEALLKQGTTRKPVEVSS